MHFTRFSHTYILGCLPNNSTAISTKSLWTLPPTTAQPLLKSRSLETKLLKRGIAIRIESTVTDLVRRCLRSPLHHLLGVCPKCRPDTRSRQVGELLRRNWLVNGGQPSDLREGLDHLLGCDTRAQHEVVLSVRLWAELEYSYFKRKEQVDMLVAFPSDRLCGPLDVIRFMVGGTYSLRKCPCRRLDRSTVQPGRWAWESQTE